MFDTAKAGSTDQPDGTPPHLQATRILSLPNSAASCAVRAWTAPLLAMAAVAGTPAMA